MSDNNVMVSAAASGERVEHLADCVLERKRRLDTEAYLDLTEVWHIARHRDRSSEFVPIRCSSDEGIMVPEPIRRRVPTCPDCLALTGAEAGTDD